MDAGDIAPSGGFAVQCPIHDRRKSMSVVTPEKPQTAMRVSCTQPALDLMKKLEGLHGPLLFHQSGGCCDGSSPMCYPRKEFKVGAQDVYMGEIGRPAT